jgi:hypothetical protein
LVVESFYTVLGQVCISAMPESSSDPANGNGKRSLPSWMGPGGGEGSPGKKKHAEETREMAQTGPDFSKLLVLIWSPLCLQWDV